MAAVSGITDVVNYLVPATGSTKVMVFSQVFSVIPFPFDFRQTDIDQEQFRPSGVFIDNTQGTGAVVVTINEMNWSISCPAGSSLARQYPAPMAQSVAITGQGQATVIFSDFPVIPFASSSGSTITGAVSVTNLPTIPSLPVGAVPVHANVSGANSATVATMPAVAGKTNYVTGFEVFGFGATTGGSQSAFLQGTLGGTINYGFVVPAGTTVEIPRIIMQFNPPIPASGANVAISVALAAWGAGNIYEMASIHGYVL